MESNKESLRPIVGVGVYILNKNGEVLLGKRKNSVGEGTFAAPGGRLEFGEEFEQAVRREVKEETGLEIGGIEMFHVYNTLQYIPTKQEHYVTLAYTAEYIGGEPMVTEPEKCEAWNWYSLDKLPSPLSEFTKIGIAKLKTVV